MKTKTSTKKSADNSNACLLFLKNRGGKARLSELTFSQTVIQDLITKEIAKVNPFGNSKLLIQNSKLKRLMGVCT
ncbi:hypothetical protein [Nostoc sp. FACHB-280]|uniref:hypothetical protein n=1 Tax=Nostoc sp. FACHB-280 TaxID=2692839 RepID=UPI00168B3C8E|nr:hypothetical protein [Nostoc sp. FACHB-280]MBD2496760.1 hypothetical protein [Nostoc sp. FACHB-280]